METNNYVDLKGFEDKYEICVNYPYEIRKKNNNKVIKEYKENTGYNRLNLKGVVSLRFSLRVVKMEE